MPIVPLPQFEADLLADQADRDEYARLSAPKTLVVRFGRMKLVGEFPWDSQEKPGCGSKIVVRTHRGTEIGEMLTSTCSNNGCSKSVSRSEMLKYIENSGGRDYPFFTDGRALRVATREDMDRQAAVEQSANALRLEARRIAAELGIPAKIVDAEPILGGELVTFFYASEERLDMTRLVPRLREVVNTRVDVRQVGARDEARLTADYERCGQYCCCKNFLKVLKPVSMKSAKIQKATLDPLKISGRCGRLMCCLRYEDETYDDLRKRLPRKRARVGTPEGDGTVIDAQILTQLVLVELDEPGPSGKIEQVAIPVENLTPPLREKPLPRPAPDLPPPPGPRAGPTAGPSSGNAPPAPRPPRPRAPDESVEPTRPNPQQQNTSQSNPPRSGGSRPGPQSGPQSGPSPRSGPEAPGGNRGALPVRRPSGPSKPPPAPRPPIDEIDLDDVETDMGDHPPSGNRGPDRQPGPDPSGEGIGSRGKRRRRRRRGPGPSGGPGTGPNSGPPGPASP